MENPQALFQFQISLPNDATKLHHLLSLRDRSRQILKLRSQWMRLWPPNQTPQPLLCRLHTHKGLKLDRDSMGTVLSLGFTPSLKQQPFPELHYHQQTTSYDPVPFVPSRHKRNTISKAPELDISATKEKITSP